MQRGLSCLLCEPAHKDDAQGVFVGCSVFLGVVCTIQTEPQRDSQAKRCPFRCASGFNLTLQCELEKVEAIVQTERDTKQTFQG